VWRTEADGLDWTYLSPAAEIGPGERTGKYRTTGDQLLTDSAGKSFISFEDYAVAVLDELERPKHVGRRFGSRIREWRGAAVCRRCRLHTSAVTLVESSP
jgi:uncharacterized protein